MAAPLKEQLADFAIHTIADVLQKIYPNFASQSFIAQALQGLETLELKQRVQHIIVVLANHLPQDFEQTAAILQAIPEHWPKQINQTYWTFVAWPLIDYVAVYGLAQPQIALPTLAKLTPLFTAEFAIRPFLQHHFEITYGYMQQWAQHEHEHIRRLASEGLRSRLPWGQRVAKLLAEPQWAIGILQQLKDDSSDYVQRSVANNLNDLSKDYPQQVIELAQQWLKDTPTAQRQWIIKHGTRGLIKAGHADALGLLGYKTQIAIENIKFKVDKTQVNMGESVSLNLSFDLPFAQALVIDYVLYLPRANGKHSQKVFKWKTAKFSQGQQQLTTNFSFKEITTRRYYAGEHRFVVLVNGQERAEASINLNVLDKPLTTK
ncbi:MAG TPA: DNA alkylation repair protein [Agitococcus sp.]|nr:DNA alkylation repair protein [Agitococcus sp.]